MDSSPLFHFYFGWDSLPSEDRPAGGSPPKLFSNISSICSISISIVVVVVVVSVVSVVIIGCSSISSSCGCNMIPFSGIAMHVEELIAVSCTASKKKQNTCTSCNFSQDSCVCNTCVCASTGFGAAILDRDLSQTCL